MILKNKHVVVVGLARTGVAASKFLVSRGAKVTVTDLKKKTELSSFIKDLSDLKRIKYVLGSHPIKTLLKADFIIVSPGVPTNIPLLEAARKNKMPVLSEVEFASQYIRCPIIAITGTNGKTTTTMIVGKMFLNAQKKVFIGGNIGTPLTYMLLSKEKFEVVVCEVSSFQLENIEKFHPKASIILNLTPDHMDRHSPEEYWKMKGRIFENQTIKDFLILNAGDERVKTYETIAKSQIYYFGVERLTPKQEGVYFKNGKFCMKLKGSEKETYSADKLKLKGDHNKENFMAAILVGKLLKCKPEAIQKTIDEFQAVPHRLEFVKTAGYVDFYNDSKATNVHSVAKSLQSFEKPLVLIMGGKDTDQNFEMLRSLVQEHVKILIITGEAKEKINRAIGDYSETYVVGTFEEAIFMAYQKSRAGDVILFSPGCKSFDAFKNFEERGDRFKEMIRDI